jgi:hypothetical protein
MTPAVGTQRPRCFEEGDRYGLEVYQMQRLPKGFYCKVSADENADAGSLQIPSAADDNNKVVFEPDGRRGVGSIGKIVVFEKIAEDNARNRVSFKIESSGKITVEPIS